MQDINLVVMTARVVRQPKICNSSFGDYAMVTVAVTKNIKNTLTGQYEEKSYFVTCMAGTFLVDKVKDFRKGDSVHLQGSLEVTSTKKNDSWETKCAVRLDKITRVKKAGYQESAIDYGPELTTEASSTSLDDIPF